MCIGIKITTPSQYLIPIIIIIIQSHRFLADFDFYQSWCFEDFAHNSTCYTAFVRHRHKLITANLPWVVKQAKNARFLLALHWENVNLFT